MEVSEKIKVYDKSVQVNGPEKVHETLISYRLGDMWATELDNTKDLRLVATEFIDSIQSGRNPINDGISGLKVVKILEALEMSIKRKGREVKL